MTQGFFLDIMVVYVLKRLLWADFRPRMPLVMRCPKFQFTSIMACHAILGL